MGKANIRFGLELRSIEKKSPLKKQKRRQSSKAARTSGPAFRHMGKSSQTLLSAVYVADASKDMSDVMKDGKSK